MVKEKGKKTEETLLGSFRFEVEPGSATAIGEVFWVHFHVVRGGVILDLLMGAHRTVTVLTVAEFMAFKELVTRFDPQLGRVEVIDPRNN